MLLTEALAPMSAPLLEIPMATPFCGAQITVNLVLLFLIVQM
jgi:hypothetical protein